MFDPPHNGHVQLATDAIRELRLDLLLVVVAARPPHRAAPAVPAEARLELCRQAFGDIDRVEASSIEIDREGTGYMLETLRQVQREREPQHLQLVLGADQLLEFAHWHGWREILETAQLGVANRPGTEAAAVETVVRELRAAGGDLIQFSTTPVGASSTLCRASAAAGDTEGLCELVPAQIVDEVLRLYGVAG